MYLDCATDSYRKNFNEQILITWKLPSLIGKLPSLIGTISHISSEIISLISTRIEKFGCVNSSFFFALIFFARILVFFCAHFFLQFWSRKFLPENK
jgi:hypothetical protein